MKNWGHGSKKWQKQKIKCFWSDSIHNGSKRILKRKSQLWKFSLMTFFGRHSRFFKKMESCVEKMGKTKNCSAKNFSIGIESELFKDILKWEFWFWRAILGCSGNSWRPITTKWFDQSKILCKVIDTSHINLHTNFHHPSSIYMVAHQLLL